MKVKDFYNTYKNYQLANMARTTFMTRSSLLRCNLLPRYGNSELSSIRPADINLLYHDMQKDGFSHNSVFGMRAALNSFFSLAVANGMISKNPVCDAEVIHPLLRKSA